jgi:hypothetical protein
MHADHAAHLLRALRLSRMEAESTDADSSCDDEDEEEEEKDEEEAKDGRVREDSVVEAKRWRRSPTTGRRTRRVKLPCPEVVVEYHRWMRGVDVFSQRQSYSRPGRKSPRWWRPLAWFLIDICILNARVLYSEHRPAAGLPKTSATAFRYDLLRALIGTFTSRKKRGRPLTHKLAADEPQHIPQLSRPQHTPCVVCAKGLRLSNGQHKPRTREGCETCNVAVHIACWRKHLPHESDDEEGKQS